MGAPKLSATISAEALSSRVARGTYWTLIGYGASQALRLVNNLVLWRLLDPEAFGLMAIVSVCLVGIGMFSDIGIGPSIVQHARGDDPKYLNTAWTIQVAREILLCAAAFILAAPVAAFYKEPELANLLPAAALGSLVSGFNSTSVFTATRTISLGRLNVIDLVSQAAGLSVMIGWAFAYRTVWSLVIGSAVSNAIRMLLSHTYLPGIRNHFHWDPDCARILLRFGRWIFLSTLLTFVVMQSDRLIFGKLIPMGLLGVYSVAATWVGLPLNIVSRVFGSALFPFLSRLKNEGANFSAPFRQMRRPWLLLSGYAVACLACGGPTLIELLYEPKAASAGWIIQVLALGVWFQALEASNGIALLASGQPKWVAAGNLAKLAGMVVLIPLGYGSHGFFGAVAALAATEVFHYGMSVIGARRCGVATLAQDMRLSTLVVGTTMVGMVAARWGSPWIRSFDLRPAKLAVVLEGLVIAIVVGLGWANAFLMHQRERRKLIRI